MVDFQKRPCYTCATSLVILTPVHSTLSLTEEMKRYSIQSQNTDFLFRKIVEFIESRISMAGIL